MCGIQCALSVITDFVSIQDLEFNSILALSDVELQTASGASTSTLSFVALKRFVVAANGPEPALRGEGPPTSNDPYHHYTT